MTALERLDKAIDALRPYCEEKNQHWSYSDLKQGEFFEIAKELDVKEFQAIGAGAMTLSYTIMRGEHEATVILRSSNKPHVRFFKSYDALVSCLMKNLGADKFNLLLDVAVKHGSPSFD